MKLKRNSNIIIAKNKMSKANTVLEPLDYYKWVEFIDNHSDFFIWKENTPEGIQILKSINDIPKDFRERVLGSLNKTNCYADFDNKKGHFNIRVGFGGKYNWISIDFARKPKPKDLNIFIEMAKYLDAYLLFNGTKIINEDTLNDLT